MKKILLLAFAAVMLLSCAEQDNIEVAVRHMVEHHPQTTLQDVYKSFYQDRFGAGHMISDTAAVREYLLYELSVAAADKSKPLVPTV